MSKEVDRFLALFRGCQCHTDTDRVRAAYLWNTDSRLVGTSGIFPSCCLPSMRATVAEMSRDQKPSVLVVIKPHPWLIAMADRMGEPIQ